MSHRDGGRLRKALLISTVIHLGLVGLVWALSSRVQPLPEMRVYAVNIVSPPPQEQGEPTPEPEAATEPEPDPEPSEPEPEPEPEPPQPEPAPAPPQRTAPRQEPRPTPPPRQAPPEPQPEREPERQRPAPPSRGNQPDPTSAGGENINLQLRGVQCPTPDYCNNIIRQVNRYFRSPGGAGVADVYFVINRDGSVSDLRLQSSSGGAAFRLAVMEAVEQAGINKAFGALPQAYQADQLPVSFYFRPSR